MKRSRALAAALYPGACLPSLSPERMRSRTASKSGNCPVCCLREEFSALRLLTPPSTQSPLLLIAAIQYLAQGWSTVLPGFPAR